MNDEALAADDSNKADLIHCPGCGGAWQESSEAQVGDAVCSRCGLSRREAAGLLWEHAGDAYAAARSAALGGRFRDARQLLRPFLSSETGTENLRKLDALCATVLGEREQEKSPGALVLAQADYAAAYRAAESRDFGAAVLLAERCMTSAPYLLPAQKLCVLALAGAGQAHKAELRRSHLAAWLPEEPDITRWKFFETLGPIPTAPIPRVTSRHGQRSRRRAASPAPRAAVVSQRRQEERRGPAIPLAATALILAAVSTTISLWRVGTVSANSTASVIMPVPTPPPLVGTTSPVAASERETYSLPGGLRQELAERHHRADFEQARRWFNGAVQAKNAGNWHECDRLAAAAYHLGKNTYLGDESLVLRALAADNNGERPAIRVMRYASIVELTPNSVYAAWALSRAAVLAGQMGQAGKANQYRKALSRRYPRFRTERSAMEQTEVKADWAADKHGHKQY